MAHFDIPLDLPHAGRIAERIVVLLERHAEELQIDAADPLDTAERLSSMLFRLGEENPPEPDAYRIRDEAAQLGRVLVDQLEATKIRSDRLGQLIRNLFECLELGEEGSEISLRAGENPNSIQRPM